MANKIIQATALPTGEQGQIIYIDNGDGTYTQTVAFDRDTYPSREQDIVAGASIVAGSSGIPMLGIPTPPGAEYLRVFQALLSLGDNDLYTVPAGKRVFVLLNTFYNTTANPRIARTEVKIGGTYYAISQATTVNANVAAAATVPLQPILEAGDILAINTDGGAALNTEFRLLQFDNTFGLKTARLLSLASGNNTVYTVPAGKKAWPFNTNPNNSLNGDAAIGYVNRSTAARAIASFFVPSGQSAIQLATVGAQADGTIGIANRCAPSLMTAGDAAVISTNSANAEQTAWLNVYEFDA